MSCRNEDQNEGQTTPHEAHLFYVTSLSRSKYWKITLILQHGINLLYFNILK